MILNVLILNIFEHIFEHVKNFNNIKCHTYGIHFNFVFIINYILY